MAGVKITLEYSSVEETIAALGKLVGITSAVAAPPVVKPPRKGRADAGQPRGPHKDNANAGTGGGASVPSAAPANHAGAGAVSAPVPAAVPAAAPSNAVAGTGTPAGTQPHAGAGQSAPAQAPTAAPAAAAVPAQEAVQAAVEKLFNAKGYDDTAALLSRFGVNRGQNLLPSQRAEFIAEVDAVLAGKKI